MNTLIRQAITTDIQVMLTGFPNSISQFKQYFQAQNEGKRIVGVAYCNNQFAGYVTLVWQSEYEPFSSQNIPEIKDLNVLPDYRKLGIAMQLIKTAEAEALGRGNAIMGIGVGLFSDYGPAQRLYFKLGYQPDGRGVTHNSKFASYGEKVLIDDEFCLWLIKDLT